MSTAQGLGDLGTLSALLKVEPAPPAASQAASQAALGESRESFIGAAAGIGGMGLYGGHLLGQAVAAAHQTAEADSRINSLHSFFLLAGDGLVPVTYEVSRIRQGRSFGTRRVQAFQPAASEQAVAELVSTGSVSTGSASTGHRQIFELSASFHKPEAESVEPMSVPVPTGLADPSTLPTFADCIAELGPIFGEHWSFYPRPVEYRVARAPWLQVGASERQGIDFWFRVERPLPDDHRLHSAFLAYMSDDCLSDNVGVPYGITAGAEDVMMASLDHSMWFHRPVRVDEWVYVEQWPLACAGARGTAQARFWQDDQLVATAVQEALARF